MEPMLTRRTVLAFGAVAAMLPLPAHAATLPKITVHKDPSCGCCGGWVAHLRANGFAADVIDTAEINRVKARLGVPATVHACHTAEIDRYVIEGHVPAGAIKRLLSERPEARGLAVPGMPVGSPGMEVEGSPPETYEVVLFGPAGSRAFARYRGAEEISG